MRVMHLLQSNRFSGAENVACQIIELFRSNDNVQHVFCSTDGPIRASIENRGIEYIGLKDFSTLSIGQSIKRINPDIIHAHDMHACFKASLCCGGRKLVCHIHNNNIDSRKLTIKTALFYFAAKRATHIIWVSDSSYESFYFRDCFKTKSSILYNIIDIQDLYRKMQLDKKTYNYDVVFLGRLSEPKNPERLIRVFSKIRSIKPDIKLAIVGTGELEEQVKKMISENDLYKNLDFLGYQTNPYKILHDSKVMLMTSIWEGTPMCSLEAMSLGVPIVSTPTDGICRVVKQGVTGFLSDEDDELVNKCLEIINNPEKRLVMSRSSSARATELMNTESYFNSINKIYTDALD